MARLKAIGERGTWYATVAGERLPCVHDAQMQPDKTYRATKVTDARHDDLLEAIVRSGKLVVRKSTRPNENASWTSNGYVGLFEVADAQIVDDVLTFRFVKRLADLQD